MPDERSLCLSIDTASDTAGIALLESGALLGEITWHARQSHSRQLLPAVDWVLKHVDRTKEHLSSSDVAVAATRRLILDTIAAYEAGELPPGSARTPGGVHIPHPYDATLAPGESWHDLQPAT